MSEGEVRALKRGEWQRTADGTVYTFQDTAKFGSGGAEVKIDAMIRRFETPHRWVATLTVDGSKVHESEHESPIDAAETIGNAAMRATKIRWRP